jgi:hypothetical protein
VVTATGRDNCRLFLGVQAENALLAECRRFLRNEAVRQPTIYTGRTGASSRAAKSSFVPPPDGGPVSMRHLLFGHHGAHSLAASDLIAVLSVVHRPGHRYSAGAAHLVASSTQTGLPHINGDITFAYQTPASHGGIRLCPAMCCSGSQEPASPGG